jgi:hypothetical protein
VNSLKRFLKSLLFSAFFYRPVISLFAQGTFSVVSTNDGNGQFSWIFSASGGSFPELDQFKMKLYGVQHASSPDGWANNRFGRISNLELSRHWRCAFYRFADDIVDP